MGRDSRCREDEVPCVPVVVTDDDAPVVGDRDSEPTAHRMYRHSDGRPLGRAETLEGTGRDG